MSPGRTPVSWSRGRDLNPRPADYEWKSPYSDELLDAYIFIEDADMLHAEYASQGVEFTRGLADMPWRTREFVVKDCDGRLLAFGANL